MVAAVAAGVADRAVDLLTARGVPTWIAGTIQRRTDAAAPAAGLVGSYR
jgi:phosphoribosylformylglycinamidine cyclo-ligase